MYAALLPDLRGSQAQGPGAGDYRRALRHRHCRAGGAVHVAPVQAGHGHGHHLGVAFGGETGFLVGAMTMLASNVLMGQGPWTPYQMFAMGIIGFLAGVLFRKGWLRRSRGALCVFGALAAILIYGGIMNPAALFMSVYQFSWSGLLAIYISGVPVDLVHASSTFLFLWIGAKPLLEKLQRIKVKYGLL